VADCRRAWWRVFVDAQAVKKTEAALDASELHHAGVMLQQSIDLTRSRISGMGNSRLKVRATRICNEAALMLGQLHFALDGMNRVMNKTGFTLKDIFGLFDNEKLVRGIAAVGVEAIVHSARKQLDALAAVNLEIDRR
jgi:hypothetical protein